jgi:hypothetical protein
MPGRSAKAAAFPLNLPPAPPRPYGFVRSKHRLAK